MQNQSPKLELQKLCRVIWVDQVDLDKAPKKFIIQNFKIILQEHFVAKKTMQQAVSVVQKEKEFLHLIICSLNQISKFQQLILDKGIKNVYHKCLVLCQKDKQQLKNYNIIIKAHSSQVFFLCPHITEIDKQCRKNNEYMQFSKKPLESFINIKLIYEFPYTLKQNHEIFWINTDGIRNLQSPQIDIKLLQYQEIQQILQEKESQYKHFIVITDDLTSQCHKWCSNVQVKFIKILFYAQNIQQSNQLLKKIPTDEFVKICSNQNQILKQLKEADFFNNA